MSALLDTDLSQPVEELHLLLTEVQRLVHHEPGDRLPAARVGGAPLIMRVMMTGIMTVIIMMILTSYVT